ncbi:MAG: hypothetical protein Q4C73_07750 [Eubacteriales bacterium]|nr:hypothetical protein [Eubacteriales bacterium]
MPTSLNEIQALYRKCHYKTIAALALLLVSLALFLVNRWLSLPFILAAVFCQFYFARRSRKLYAQAVTSVNLQKTLCRVLGAAAPQEKSSGAVTAGIIRRSGLMPFREEKNSPLLCWQIQGRLGKLPVSLCDATLTEDYHMPGSGKKRVHFNSGVWAHFDLPSNTGRQFSIVDPDAIPEAVRNEFFSESKGFKAVSLEPETAGRRFILYCPADQENELPPVLFLSALKRLARYTPGYPALSVNGSQLDVFLRNRFLSRPVPYTTAPTEKLLGADPFPELSYLTDLAKAASGSAS